MKGNSIQRYYVTYDDYPQSEVDAANIGRIYDNATSFPRYIKRGHLEMFIDMDGSYNVKKDAAWYKVEPIVWEVIGDYTDAENNSGNLLLWSEVVLDKQKFGNSISNGQNGAWGTSEMQQFLNNDFYDAAFESKTHIQNVKLDNSFESAIPVNGTRNYAYSVKGGDNKYTFRWYISEPQTVSPKESKVFNNSIRQKAEYSGITDDKVFLLSVKELTSPSYYFKDGILSYGISATDNSFSLDLTKIYSINETLGESLILTVDEVKQLPTLSASMLPDGVTISDDNKITLTAERRVNQDGTNLNKMPPRDGRIFILSGSARNADKSERRHREASAYAGGGYTHYLTRSPLVRANKSLTDVTPDVAVVFCNPENAAISAGGELSFDKNTAAGIIPAICVNKEMVEGIINAAITP